MIFCIDCFQDAEIRAIIKKRGKPGKCPICGTENVFVYDTEIDSTLAGICDNLLSVYTSDRDLPQSYPEEELKTLVNAVRHDWDVFSDISDEAILHLLLKMMT